MMSKRAASILVGLALLMPLAVTAKTRPDRCTDEDQCELLENIQARLGDLLQPPAWVVQAVAAKGPAAPGNAEPFNLLVVVTNSRTGAAVTTLTQPAFAVIGHLGPGGCSFTNQIKSFNNVGTGAYQLGMGFSDAIPGCAWVGGEYLGQVRLPSA